MIFIAIFTIASSKVSNPKITCEKTIIKFRTFFNIIIEINISLMVSYNDNLLV